ncbi:CDP-glycerol glycerophosphotransferase family protein [Fructilactobacillus fructivorans]
MVMKVKVIYTWLIRLISTIFYFRPKKNIYYVMSFDNNLRLIKQIAANMPEGQELVVLYEPEIEAAATDLSAFGIKTIPFKENARFALLTIPSLMSARVLFCDNYFPFLAGLVRPKKKMKIVQLWHADGAIKCFGWEDPTTNKRSFFDKLRFQSVYNHFDDFVVASKAMGHIFERSYRESPDKMKYLGYPSSDRLFKERWRRVARHRVYEVAPELKGKRVILYAPTYRDGLEFDPPKDIGEALTADPDAITVVKLHPLLRDQESRIRKFSNGNIRFYNQLSTSDLLSVCNTLVTDYSSVAFDFSLLPQAHSMIFFMFDLKQYEQGPGIQKDFLEWLPSEPITRVDQLTQAIVANQKIDFTSFNKHWNTYNDGYATERVIKRYVLQNN